VNVADSKEREQLHERGLVFFGKITASVTHELNNVMSIIEQVSGLLDDLCAGAENGKPLDPVKVRGISERIGKQVERGVSIIQRMNKFAHSVDEPVKNFELNELTENLVELSRRFAGLRKLRLEWRPGGAPVMLVSKPFLLEQVIFTGIEAAMQRSRREGAVRIEVRPDDAGARIGISTETEAAAQSELPDAPDATERLLHSDPAAVLCAELAATLKVSAAQGKWNWELLLPNLSAEVSK
jgi:signal transduction histidine kinase